MEREKKLQWRKSSYSHRNGECVEVTADVPGAVAIRDSKRQDGHVLVVSPSAFRALIRR